MSVSSVSFNYSVETGMNRGIVYRDCNTFQIFFWLKIFSGRKGMLRHPKSISGGKAFPGKAYNTYQWEKQGISQFDRH